MNLIFCNLIETVQFPETCFFTNAKFCFHVNKYISKEDKNNLTEDMLLTNFPLFHLQNPLVPLII